MSVKNQKQEYTYLLEAYNITHTYLTKKEADECSSKDFSELVINFWLIVEKILKIRLYQKNPALVFRCSDLQSEDQLIAIAKECEDCINTVKFEKVLNRFKKVFKNVFEVEEIKAIEDIYKVRNNIIHSYKSCEDLDLDEEAAFKKMGSIWTKLTEQAEIILGPSIQKGNPKETYTKEELRKMLEDAVREKIGYNEKIGNDKIDCFVDESEVGPFYDAFRAPTCPRCNTPGFSKKRIRTNNLSSEPFIYEASQENKKDYSELYKCEECNLELTEEEYKIAKEIKNN